MLAPHLALDPHQLEAGGAVQGNRGLVVPGDAGDDGVEPVGGGAHEQLGEQRPADAPSPLGPVDVDGVLGRGGVARTVPKGREGSEPEDDLAVGALGPEVPEPGGSMATRAGWTPLCSRIQASCSARVRGTMSKVLVLWSTSTL